MFETLKDILAVARYCSGFPKGNFLSKCYHVYLWRKEIGFIHPSASIVDVIKGIVNYGRWLRRL